MDVLSSPDDRFLSALEGNTILDVEKFRASRISVRIWPVDLSNEAGRPARCLKPEMFHVWREGVDMCVTKVVASSESLATFDVFVLDAGDTLYVWGGEQCSQLEVKLTQSSLNTADRCRTVPSRGPALQAKFLEASRRRGA